MADQIKIRRPLTGAPERDSGPGTKRTSFVPETISRKGNEHGGFVVLALAALFVTLQVVPRGVDD